MVFFIIFIYFFSIATVLMKKSNSHGLNSRFVPDLWGVFTINHSIYTFTWGKTVASLCLGAGKFLIDDPFIMSRLSIIILPMLRYVGDDGQDKIISRE